MSERLYSPRVNELIGQILGRRRKFRHFRHLFESPVVSGCLDELVHHETLLDKQRVLSKANLLDSLCIFGNGRRKLDKADYGSGHIYLVGEILWDLYKDDENVDVNELMFMAYSHDNPEKLMETLPYKEKISNRVRGRGKTDGLTILHPDKEEDIFVRYLARLGNLLESLDIDTNEKETKMVLEDNIEVTRYLTVKPEQDYYGHLGEASKREEELHKNGGDVKEKKRLRDLLIKKTIIKLADSLDTQSRGLVKEDNAENYAEKELEQRIQRIRLGESISTPPEEMVKLYKAAKNKHWLSPDSLRYARLMRRNIKGNKLRNPKTWKGWRIVRSCYKAINIINQTRRDFAEADEEGRYAVKRPEIKKIYDIYVDNQLRVIDLVLDVMKRSRFYPSQADDLGWKEQELGEEYSQGTFFELKHNGLELVSSGAAIRQHRLLEKKRRRGIYSPFGRRRFNQIYTDLLIEKYWILGYKENKIWYLRELSSDLEEMVNGNSKQHIRGNADAVNEANS